MAQLPEPLQQIGRTCVLWRGKKFHYFAGCDYLGMAREPRVLRAASKALRQFGLNVAASRKTTGNHPLYGLLEKELASFFKVGRALLVSSGYATNLAVAQALQGWPAAMLLDELAHASLKDAAALAGFKVVPFRHRDPVDFAKKAARHRNKRILAASDGVFALNGRIAPLPEYLRVLPQNALFLLDDSHAAGVLGAVGRGTTEHFQIADQRVIQTVTLSKAFGAYGGAILGSEALAGEIIAKSRLFTGNTPLPLPLAAAAIASINLVKTGACRVNLGRNLRYFKEKWMRDHDWEPPAAILGIAPATDLDQKRLARSLIRRRIYPAFIHYPGGPSSGVFRFAFSSQHTRTQLDALGGALSEITGYKVL